MGALSNLYATTIGKKVVMALSGLNVALPAIQDDLSTTGTEIIWIVDSYAIVFAGLLMIAGAMSDKWGRKGALQLGLIGFAAGAVVAAAADSAGFGLESVRERLDLHYGGDYDFALEEEGGVVATIRLPQGPDGTEEEQDGPL